MTLKDRMRLNAGVTKQQNINEEIEDLNEGLVFFKNSKRLAKLAKKMESQFTTYKGPDEKSIKSAISDIKDVAKEFAELETVYASGDKKKTREKYKALKSKHSGLVKKINTESFKKFANAVGTVAVIGLIASAFSAGALGGLAAGFDAGKASSLPTLNR